MGCCGKKRNDQLQNLKFNTPYGNLTANDYRRQVLDRYKKAKRANSGQEK